MPTPASAFGLPSLRSNGPSTALHFAFTVPVCAYALLEELLVHLCLGHESCVHIGAAQLN